MKVKEKYSLIIERLKEQPKDCLRLAANLKISGGEKCVLTDEQITNLNCFIDYTYKKEQDFKSKSCYGNINNAEDKIYYCELFDGYAENYLDCVRNYYPECNL